MYHMPQKLDTWTSYEKHHVVDEGLKIYIVNTEHMYPLTTD